MKKIVVVPGHTPEDPGRKVGVISEYGLTCELAGKIVRYLHQTGYEAHLIGSGSTTEQIVKINSLNADLGIELHFNGFSNEVMNGTEMLHAGSTMGVKLAKHLQDVLVGALGTKDRGVKKGHYRLDPANKVMPILRLTNCPFIIVEPLFLTNIKDLSRLDIDLIAHVIIDGIQNYLNEV